MLPAAAVSEIVQALGIFFEEVKIRHVRKTLKWTMQSQFYLIVMSDASDLVQAWAFYLVCKTSVGNSVSTSSKKKLLPIQKDPSEETIEMDRLQRCALGGARSTSEAQTLSSNHTSASTGFEFETGTYNIHLDMALSGGSRQKASDTIIPFHIISSVQYVNEE